MGVLAVLDTNVILSAQITHNLESPPAKLYRAIMDERIIPIYHPEILEEYREVFSRSKFHLSPEVVEMILLTITTYGENIDAVMNDELFPDEKDRIFYEVTLSRREDGARLVTGNIRHFPKKGFVVTPAEMVRLLGI